MESVYASHVRVEFQENLVDPAQDDSLGGLFLLIKFEGEAGYHGLIRTTSKVRGGKSYNLDTCQFIGVNTGDWLSQQKVEPDVREFALGHISGVGFFYISGENGSAATKSLQVGSVHAKGDLNWPRLDGKTENVHVRAGDTVTLRWDFPSGLPAKFHWFRNEKPVQDAQGPVYRYTPSKENIMTHVFRAEATLENGQLIPMGDFRVQVVRSAAPVIRMQSGDTSVPIGGDVIFRIKAEGMEPLALQWFRNAKPIVGAKQILYTFEPTSINEGGQYYCEVTDRQGLVARSRQVGLIIKPGPGADGWLPEGFSVSAKVGVNLSDYYRDESGLPASEFQFNYFHAGLQADWLFRPAVGLQADLLFVRKSVGRTYSDHSALLLMNTLESPLLVKIRLVKSMPKTPLYALIGGYAAYVLSADMENDWGSWKTSGPADGYASWDYGPTVGMSWQIGVLSLEWRYSLGLADLGGGNGTGQMMMGAVSGTIGFSLFSAQDSAR